MFRQSRRSRSRKTQATETLEYRRLLTVAVSATSTTMTIVGTGANEQIRLVGVGVEALGGTTVNLDQSYLDNRFDIDTIVIQMKGGDDVVEITRLFGMERVTISGGAGDNTVEVEDSQIEQLTIDNGTGNDLNIIRRVQIGKDGERNTGLLAIDNGNGGSTTSITSTLSNPGGGPSSGNSMHTNLVVIRNGTGSHDVDFANVRLRRATVLIESENSNRHHTTFKDVDRVRNLFVRHDNTEVAVGGMDALVDLDNLYVESGNVRIESDANPESPSRKDSVVRVKDGLVKGKFEHLTFGLGGPGHVESQSVTEFNNGSLIQGTVNVKDLLFGRSTVRVRSAVFGGNVGFTLLGFPGSLSVIDVDDAVFVKKVNAFSTGGGELDIDLKNTTFASTVTIKVPDDKAGDGSVVTDTDLTIEDALFRKKLVFKSGSGNDVVAIDDSEFQKNVTITTGAKPNGLFPDTDSVLIEQSTGSQKSEFRGSTKISTGAGADLVQIGGLLGSSEVEFGRVPKLNGGADNRGPAFENDRLFVGLSVSLGGLAKPKLFEFVAGL